MDPAEQLELVRDFMLAVAPAVTHAHQDQGGFTAAETAKAVLELGMHLASQYAQCHDALHASPENSPKENPIKAHVAIAEGKTAPLR